MKSGIYDEILLRYLVKHFEGPVEGNPETVETGYGLWSGLLSAGRKDPGVQYVYQGAILPRG